MPCQDDQGDLVPPTDGPRPPLRVAMLGVDVDVHEPPELIAHLAMMADRLGRAAYGAQQGTP